MKILKQQQINAIQHIAQNSGVALTKTQCEAAYDSFFAMLAVHQKSGDSVITKIGTFYSYVRPATTYTNPQHPEGMRIEASARIIPKLKFGRNYYASFKSLPLD